MARIRTIKPDFFTSADIVELSPLARLLYIAVWCEADREGRLVWRPKTLKLRYYPADDVSLDNLANELIAAGLVVPYEVDGQAFAVVPTFTRHQMINNRETPSVIPARVDDATGTREPREDDACGTRGARVDDATGTPLVGMEGKEGNARHDASSTSSAPAKKKSQQSALPDGFGVSDRVRTWAAEKGFGDLDLQLEALISYAKRKGAKYADWDEALMTAVRDDWAKQRVNGYGSNDLDKMFQRGAH